MTDAAKPSAVVSAGGKQYRVCPGDTIVMELLGAEDGAAQTFEQVLMVENGGKIQVGAPYLENVRVRATVLESFRADKVRVFKMRRRKKSRRTQGHRQHLSRLSIDAIEGV